MGLGMGRLEEECLMWYKAVKISDSVINSELTLNTSEEVYQRASDKL